VICDAKTVTKMNSYLPAFLEAAYLSNWQASADSTSWS